MDWFELLGTLQQLLFTSVIGQEVTQIAQHIKP